MTGVVERKLPWPPEALPLLFVELRERPNFWFWALAAITRENPAAGIKGFAAARTAWLDWADAHGY